MHTPRFLLRLALTFAGLLTLSTQMAAQAPAASATSGRVVGRIIDAATGDGLPDVGVQIVGTTLGAQSGIDGRFVIRGIPAGIVGIQARRLGYSPKTVTGLTVVAGSVVEQDITLSTAAVTLNAQVVTASAERGTVGEALDKQRTSVNVVNSVTREQIARSTDSDAAQAVQRVSGVTVQDGKYVFVRGLGERYTTTSLNGARIPSPEPERRVVPLDLFPAALIQSVTTAKNFTPDQPGDFSGAQVDIRTREFPARGQVQFSSSFGFNSSATGDAIFVQPSLGGDLFGFAGSERQLPSLVAAAGDFRTSPSQSDINAMVNGFRNAWSPQIRNGSANSSFGASAGGNGRLFGAQTGYIASLSYSYAQEVRADEVRAYADVSTSGGTRESDRFSGHTGRASVLWGGLFNASMYFGSKTRLTFNNTYNRTSDNEARRETGFNENLGTDLLIDRLRFVERSVFSSQVGALRQLGSRSSLNVEFTAAGVSRNEPDRTEFVRVVPQDGTAPYWLNAGEGAVKTFGELTERNYNTAADLSLGFGPADRQHELKLGALYRFTDREALNRSYSLQASSLSLAQRRLSPEEIFNGQFTAPGSSVFRIQPLSQGGSYYSEDQLGAGYLMLQYALTSRLTAITGARVEYSLVDVVSLPTIGAPIRVQPEYTDVLPSIVFNYKLTERQNLRLSATQTLARPEYREMAEVQYRDVIGGENVVGNAQLRRTLIQNADLRWEWYPSAGEVLSLGFFAKRFKDPVERVFLATSGTRLVSFINAESAENFGVELDVRAGLDVLSDALAPFTVFSNATLIRSSVTIGENRYDVPDTDRAMVGQAPYVVNAGLTFAPGRGSTSATVLFNRVGRRIVTASDNVLPVTYEESRSVMDLSFRFPLIGGMSGKLDAKNLLDEPYRQTQGSVVRESYKAGRVFMLGLSWLK